MASPTNKPLGFRDTAALVAYNPDLSFDRAALEVDPILRYPEVVRVVEVLARLNVTKISLSAAAAKNRKCSDEIDSERRTRGERGRS